MAVFAQGVSDWMTRVRTFAERLVIDLDSLRATSLVGLRCLSRSLDWKPNLVRGERLIMIHDLE